MSPSTTTSSGLAALFSLSQAAASAQPIPISKQDSSQPGRGASTTNPHFTPKHRRLSSTGQTRRRLTEARDAVSRPSPASPHSAVSAFASLSLSSSASPPHSVHVPTSPAITSAPRPIPVPVRSSPRTEALAKSVPTHFLGEPDVDVDGEEDDDKDKSRSAKGGKGSGKKRGTIFRCESCSKVYRHPSCLVKHRWEHSPHWREASKFLLSKHQQVQLLEAAAILSHLAPGTSLPEDRSLWPSYLSGGLLPPPSTTTPLLSNGTLSAPPIHNAEAPLSATHAANPMSMSVPTHSSPLMTRAHSDSVSSSFSNSGPRMHDYRLPNGGITQIRPGLLGHRTGPGAPAPVVMTPSESDAPAASDDFGNSIPSPAPQRLVAATTSPMPVPVTANTRNYSGSYGNYRERDVGAPAHSYTPSSLSRSVGTGGWSLPHSDIRSGSVMSYSESRSRSGSRSDEEDSSDEIDADDDGNSRGRYEFGEYGFGNRMRGRVAWRVDDDDMSGLSMRTDDEARAKKEEEEEWDGMDMDMEL